MSTSAVGMVGVALLVAACGSPPALTEPHRPTVSTEPPSPASGGTVMAATEPSCPAGQEPTGDGCEPTKIAACNRLIGTINAEQEPLKGASGSNPSDLRKLAEVLDHVAGEVGAVKTTDPQLAGLRDDYAEMATDLARASRKTADALEHQDPASAAEAARDMSSLGSRERDIVAAINRSCAASDGSDAGAEVPTPTASAKGPFVASTHPAMSNPKLAAKKAPPHFAVRFDTTVGSFVVKCERAWAPHGADRFYSLVSIGYFDDVAFFRAVKDFVVQFGIHGDPDVNAAWRKANITPDLVKASNDEGTLTFAQAGQPAAPGQTADSRSVQLFLNLTDNTRLDAMGFAPLCRVSRGLDVVKRIHTGHGEQAGRDQNAIQARGNDYLRQTYPELDYIITARLVGP